MQLEDEDVREFIEIWRAEFQEELSEADGRQYASNLLELCTLLASFESTQKPTIATP